MDLTENLQMRRSRKMRRNNPRLRHTKNEAKLHSRRLNCTQVRKTFRPGSRSLRPALCSGARGVLQRKTFDRAHDQSSRIVLDVIITQRVLSARAPQTIRPVPTSFDWLGKPEQLRPSVLLQLPCEIVLILGPITDEFVASILARHGTPLRCYH